MKRRAFGLKSTDQAFQVTWYSSDELEFARSEFGKEELLDYLEEGRWLEKNRFLGERRKEEVPPRLFIGPIDEQLQWL